MNADLGADEFRMLDELAAPLRGVDDRRAWRDAHGKVFSSGLRSDRARLIWKRLRMMRNERKAKEWHDVLPPEIARWAHAVMAEKQEGMVCCDNGRVACLFSTAQKRRYARDKAAGCCGFYDEVHQGPDGKPYMIGFNYGH